MVAREKRIILEIKDVKLLRLRCRECGTEVSKSIHNQYGLPKTCPECSTAWRSDKDRTPNTTLKLMAALKEYLQTHEDNSPVNLLLEIEDD